MQRVFSFSGLRTAGLIVLDSLATTLQIPRSASGAGNAAFLTNRRLR
jgi:hypothetical protein